MTEVTVREDLLADNTRAAAQTRARLREAGVFALNLMSGPGAGKTTLVERTVDALRGRLRAAVIVGDIATERDADRIRAHGVPAVQLNTGGACHLEARAIAGVLSELPLDALDLVIIENVGNLVCPAEFDLGEHAKAMILSVTEGHDKPSKYPLMFTEARAVVLGKVDLLPHTDFDLGAARADIAALNPGVPVFELSARTGQGLDGWVGWLVDRVRAGRE